jgi:PAS domain S-box-containing protein
MLDSAATGIYLVQDGKFEYVNPLFSGISGYAPEELLGSDSMDYIHPDDRDVARTKAIENLKGLNDLPHEFRFVRKDGQSTWILEKVASIEYKGRRAAIGSFMDISERKRIEEVLRQRSRELEQRTNQLLALQKITASIQSTLDLKEILQQVANGVVHNLGFDHALIIKVDEAAKVARGAVFATKDDESKVNQFQETIRRRLTDIEIPQVRGYSRVVDNAMDGKATITHDFFEVASAILTRDESNAAAELLDAKTIVVMPLFARDRHVGSILALTNQEEISGIFLEPLRILSDQAGFAIENADLYHGVSEFAQRLSVVSALSKILGSSLDIKGVYSAFTEEVKKVMNFDRTSIAMVEGDQLRYLVVAEEVDTELKDGSKLPLSDSATGLVIKTKKTIIEPDFNQEMKFPIDHMYYNSGLRSAIRVPLFSKGEVFATFNLASRKPNAYGEREREILEQISGSLTAAIENSRLFDQVKQHEAELVKAYENLKSAQEYMVQAEKLKALGEMAGGVAHDFNNVLAVVLGRTQLALEDVKDDKLKKDLQIIEQTAIDAATTVRRLQDFARVRVERNFAVLDLKEVLESTLQMTESRRMELKEREGINIDMESKLRDTSIVEGDVAELREGLLNIIFNAMDAMPKGGKIKIEAKQTKKWVTVSISDTGIGMPKEIMDRIFEPFFTTRVHKGTGLGLSVTYGIIQRHRGEISVESTVGVGSTFYIKLPVCEGVVSKKHAAGKADAVKGVSILMVDDNPEVAGILGLTLRRLGHTVVEANSGEAAINTFEVGKFDLIITDLGMPDMSGHEVAKIVKEMKPGTPVLVISGWGGQLNLDEMPEVDGVIAKPFSKEVLAEKIAAVLSCEGTQARDLKRKAVKTKKSSKGVSKSDKADEGLTGKEKPKKKKGTDKKE